MTQTPLNPPRARGAVTNTAGRFESYRICAIDDGWGGDAAHDPELRTEVRLEEVQRVISYNRSPDLPFDRSINPYRGCEHGCIYCFARPSHAYLGLSPGLDFETRLIARPNAAAALRHALGAPRYVPAPIAIGTNTDPYQPIERDLKIMRACLGVLRDARHPVAIVTKGCLIERDIDILSAMAERGLVRVGISVTTLQGSLSRKMEPRAPSPRRRLQMIERLSRAGIDVRVMAAPVVPGLTDHELEAILQAGAAAGAKTASWIMLRLPREVAGLWQEWLEQHAPARAGKVMARLREMHDGAVYDAAWDRRMCGKGAYAEMIQMRFQAALRRYGLTAHGAPLRCDLFERPAREKSLQSGDTARQLSLFD